VTLTDLKLVSRDEAAAAVSTPVADAACCGPLTRETITAADAETFARRLKALADPARLRLVSIVAASEGQEACVCDLIEPVGLSQPTVSHISRSWLTRVCSNANSGESGPITGWCLRP
jgi:ArsR family transcriptional regulator, arsenate/arsenite/antimonite-responsive transcriptional repressor